MHFTFALFITELHPRSDFTLTLIAFLLVLINNNLYLYALLRVKNQISFHERISLSIKKN